MPELPEVQAHAERLAQAFVSHELASFRPLSFTALKTVTPAPDTAVGTALSAVTTRGKVLLMEFPTITFAVHLMQGGRLRPETKPAARPRGGLARWTFADGASLLFTEAGSEHKAGVWVSEPGVAVGPLVDLGPDADVVDRTTFDAILTEAGGSRLHGVLRDQHRIAGLGRRLSNEICWAARLSPFAPAGRLDDSERDRLFEAMRGCIEASLADERGRDEMVRSAQRLARVHHRCGEPCDRCGDAIRQVSYRAYEVDYCATCQTAGKVLADNTTSRFLK